MEDDYILDGKTYSRADLEKAYGDDVDSVIKDYGFELVKKSEDKSEKKESTYSIEGKEYGEAELKSFYGDDFESVIESYAVKKEAAPDVKKKSRLPNPIHKMAS